jgi:hypothetical protein
MSRPVHDHGVNGFGFHLSAAARNTIMILGGYLLGTFAAHVCSPLMERIALAVVLIGALSFAAQALHARQKRLHAAHMAIQKATSRVERRMDQHVRIASARLMLKLHATRGWSHEQYIPVVQSSQHGR